MPKTGVLIAGFGGPDCLDAVEPFMCNLTGRTPAAATVARVKARYEAIGGCSPLVRIAGSLADEVRASLEALDLFVPIEVGMRYWRPFIADAVRRLAAQGVERVVLVTLSPFETRVTHGEYRAALDEALAHHRGMSAVEAPLLSELPAFVFLHAEAAAGALDALDHDSAVVVFSAHSLPVTEATIDDPYVPGLRAAATEVAHRMGLGPATESAEVLPDLVAFGRPARTRPWLVAYQSKGLRGGEWLGPGVDEAIEAAAAAGRAVLIVPLGFATDHMETLYDLDVVAADLARARGIRFMRSRVPNADPHLAADIARAVVELA